MSSTGSAEPRRDDAVRVPVRLIVIGIVTVTLALVIGTQVIGVLYAILFPPVPPLPSETRLISHTNVDYGVDEWLYTVNDAPCDVLRFYRDRADECRVVPLLCDPTQPGSETVTAVNQHIARCEAQVQFSIFALRWEVVIGTGASADEPVQIKLDREVFWTGAVPPQPTLLP